MSTAEGRGVAGGCAPLNNGGGEPPPFRTGGTKRAWRSARLSYPRAESNRNRQNRNLKFYPLNYGGGVCDCKDIVFS